MFETFDITSISLSSKEHQKQANYTFHLRLILSQMLGMLTTNITAVQLNYHYNYSTANKFIS